VDLLVPAGSSSAAGPSSSVQVDQAAIRSAPALPQVQVQALPAAFQQDAGPCTRRAPRPQALPAAVRALASDRVVPVVVRVSVSDPVVRVGLPAD
jgi:hypothetical protein